MGKWFFLGVLALSSCRRIDPAQLQVDFLTALNEGDNERASRLARDVEKLKISGCTTDFLYLSLYRAEYLIQNSAYQDADEILSGHCFLQSSNQDLVNYYHILNAFIAVRKGEHFKTEQIIEQLTHNNATENPRILAMTHSLHAYILMSKGDDISAETEYIKAIRLFRKIGEVEYMAKSVVNLSLIYIRMTRYDEAVTILRENDRFISPKHRGSYHLNLGVAYTWLGKFPEGHEHLIHASNYAKKIGDLSLAQRVAGTLGTHYYLKGDSSKALNHYYNAIEIAKSSDDYTVSGGWVNSVAQILLEQREFTKANSWLDKQKWVNQGNDPVVILHEKRIKALAIHSECDPTNALDNLASLLEKSDRLGLLDVSWEVRVAMGGCFVTMGKTEEANRYYQEAIDIIEESPAMVDPSDQIPYFSRLMQWHRLYVEELIDQGNTDRALEVVESSRARELRFRNPAPKATVADFQRAAKSMNKVFMPYWVTDTMSYLWVITPEKTHMFTLPTKKNLTQWVTAHQSEVVTRLGDPARAGSKPGTLLFRYLIEPALPFLPKDAQVVLVPDGPLHDLAFETLPVPGDPGHYWIEDVALTLTPSLNLYLQEKQPLGDLSRALLVGNPNYRSAEFPPIPATGKELALIATHFPDQTTLSGDAAYRDSFFSQKPETFPIIHFAAHAEVNAQAPMDSAVILSPHKDLTETKLYARDILAYPLNGVNLVTLSACNAAGANSYAGEGLVGFAWAFLWSGAQHVVAANWNLDDGAAAQIMSHFYAELAKGASPADALRQAKRLLLHSESRYRYPYFWGAFKVYSR